MSLKPYYSDDRCVIYHGDCRVVLPGLLDTLKANVVVVDPPYNETSLAWDRWPHGWVEAVAQATRTQVPMWCFGSMRMYLEYGRRQDRVG